MFHGKDPPWMIDYIRNKIERKKSNLQIVNEITNHISKFKKQSIPKAKLLPKKKITTIDLL